MKSSDIFWRDKLAVAQICEDKGCRLYYDVLQEVYFIIKKNPDRSIDHNKSTELFRHGDIFDVAIFIDSYENL